MNASLALDFLVECCECDAVDGGSVAQLLEERGLIIQSGSETHGDVLVPRGNDAERDTRADDGFAVEVPMGETHSIVQRV